MSTTAQNNFWFAGHPSLVKNVNGVECWTWKQPNPAALHVFKAHPYIGMVGKMNVNPHPQS